MLGSTGAGVSSAPPSSPGPGVAALIERVVDPGERPVAGVLVDRPHLPVRGPEPRLAAKGEHRQLGLEAEDLRQAVVRPLLPAGRPDELEALRQSQHPRPDLVRDAVGDPVDEVEAAGHLVERPVEAEEARSPRRRRGPGAVAPRALRWPPPRAAWQERHPATICRGCAKHESADFAKAESAR